MVEAELLIGHLRSQAHQIQSLLNYLESRPHVEADDYTYTTGRLKRLISDLKSLERFTTQRGAVHQLRASWMN